MIDFKEGKDDKVLDDNDYPSLEYGGDPKRN